MRRLSAACGILLLAAGSVTGCGRLAGRVDRQIELVGSELTGVPVTVDEVRIRLASGTGEIKGLSIANPEGYTADSSFEMDLVRMNLGLVSTLAGEPLVLDELVIAYPVMNLERKSPESSNVRDIAENAKENREEADRKSAAEEPASKEKPGEPFRIVIRRLVIEGVTLNVRLADGTARSGTLPGIELRDVGGEEGVTPGGLGLAVIGAMAGEMLRQAVARELIEGEGDVRDALSAENLLEILDERLHLTPEQREGVRPAVQGVGEALASVIEAWKEQGFVDGETLAEELAPVREKFETGLEEALDSEQLQELKGFLERLEEDAVEVIRFAAVEILSERLGVTPEQAARLRPMLRENMIEVSRLLSAYVSEFGRSSEEFKSAFDEHRGKLRERLRTVLDADQLKTLEAWQDELLERIQSTWAPKIREGSERGIGGGEGR